MIMTKTVKSPNFTTITQSLSLSLHKSMSLSLCSSVKGPIKYLKNPIATGAAINACYKIILESLTKVTDIVYTSSNRLRRQRKLTGLSARSKQT